MRRNSRNNDQMIKGLSVEVRNGDFNGALRRFKKLVQDEGVIQELRARQEYVKPSEQRKRAKAAGRARWLKKLRKMQLDGMMPEYNKSKRK